MYHKINAYQEHESERILTKAKDNVLKHAILDLKRKDNAIVAIPPVLREVLRENVVPEYDLFPRAMSQAAAKQTFGECREEFDWIT